MELGVELGGPLLAALGHAVGVQVHLPAREPRERPHRGEVHVVVRRKVEGAAADVERRQPFAELAPGFVGGLEERALLVGAVDAHIVPVHQLHRRQRGQRVLEGEQPAAGLLEKDRARLDRCAEGGVGPLRVRKDGGDELGELLELLQRLVERHQQALARERHAELLEVGDAELSRLRAVCRRVVEVHRVVVRDEGDARMLGESAQQRGERAHHRVENTRRHRAVGGLNEHDDRWGQRRTRLVLGRWDDLNRAAAELGAVGGIAPVAV